MFRAKNILSEVGYIFSEDTRVTKNYWIDMILSQN